VIKYSLTVLLILISANVTFAEHKNKYDTIFFKNIENKIREDYRTCTGIDSAISLKKLIQWKQSIDNVIGRKDYQQIIKKFHADSQNTTSGVSPCEIVAWYEKKVKQQIIKDSLSKELKEKKTVQNADSLFAYKELSRAAKSQCNLHGIPFGITHRSVVRLLNDNGITEITGDTLTISYTDNSDPAFNTTALYFDKDKLFYKYEIESISGSTDSLDTYIRPLAAAQALFFEKKAGIPAQVYNYIGLTDITEHNLSIIRKWSLKSEDIYIGLSLHNNRFYAKTVVIEKKAVSPE